jgi:hypothetical protein
MLAIWVGAVLAVTGLIVKLATGLVGMGRSDGGGGAVQERIAAAESASAAWSYAVIVGVAILVIGLLVRLQSPK